MNAPCYNCENRCAGCHGSCADYKQFKAEKQATKRENEVETYLIEHAMKVHDKFVERKKSRRMRNRKRR